MKIIDSSVYTSPFFDKFFYDYFYHNYYCRKSHFTDINLKIFNNFILYFLLFLYQRLSLNIKNLIRSFRSLTNGSSMFKIIFFIGGRNIDLDFRMFWVHRPYNSTNLGTKMYITFGYTPILVYNYVVRMGTPYILKSNTMLLSIIYILAQYFVIWTL